MGAQNVAMIPYPLVFTSVNADYRCLITAVVIYTVRRDWRAYGICSHHIDMGINYRIDYGRSTTLWEDFISVNNKKCMYQWTHASMDHGHARMEMYVLHVSPIS